MIRFSRPTPFISLVAASCGIAASVALSGCGGAGTAAPSLTNPGLANGANGAGGGRAGAAGGANGGAASNVVAGKLGVFITDGFTEDYDHVWATIHKVELLEASEKSETVFESSDGVTMDVRALRDVSGGRYALLTCAPVPSTRGHNRVRVTLGKAFLLYKPGQSVAQTAEVAQTITRDEEGRPVVSFALEQPQDLGSGREDLVIDFDLANFKVVDGQVTPVLKEGDKTKLVDVSRQESREFTGTVHNLNGAAPESTFTLSLNGGKGISVKTGAATVVFNESAKPSPALADGRRVQVRGTFDVNEKRLVASQIEVAEGAEAIDGEPEVRGAVSSVNESAGTFVVSAGQVANLVPTQAAVTVVVDKEAALRSKGGLLLSRDEFFQSLRGKDTLAEVEGSFDPVTSTLTAKRVKIEDKSPADSHEAEVEGTPASVKVEDGKFTISAASAWQGITLAAATAGENKNSGVPVVTTAATAFRNEAGEFVAAKNFFAAIADGKNTVKVTGVYGGKGTLTATRIDLRPAPTKPEVDEKTAATKDEKKPEAADAKKPEGEAKQETGEPVKEEKAKPAEEAPKPEEKPKA